MATTANRHRVLIATDGSPPAEAALETAIRFPWGTSTRVRAVIARTDWIPTESPSLASTWSSHTESLPEATRRHLASRWAKPEVVFVDEYPVDAILRNAGEFNATTIVLGWRGHGTFHRLLAGSVSRAVASRAHCPVLIARQAPAAIRRFVVGYDACENARRALDFLCSLEAAARGRIMLVNVVEPLPVPRSVSLLPRPARAQFRHELKSLNDERLRKAESVLKEASTRLTTCGWAVKAEVRTGAPLARLLSAVDDHRADVLVLGARAVSGMERALLGSVANGALNRSRVPVLLVR
jgi:nucleotide-binding universal stress UspA family protein